MTVFIDTNVLLYAISELPSENSKRDSARALIDHESCAFSMQVLQEFVYQATHPRRTNRVPLDEAVQHVTAWRRFPVQETTLALLDEGLNMLRVGGFSFWDSMIVAAARAQGCELLYSEDMQDGRIVDGMRIVDPFR